VADLPSPRPSPRKGGERERSGAARASPPRPAERGEGRGEGSVQVAEPLESLLERVRACRVCEAHLPLGPRPVVRGSQTARLLITSQAPGTRVHETGLSFNDRSGDRLREWLGIDRETFYDERRIAIMPMGLCYPGVLPGGGDRPPRRECAPLWHPPLRAAFRSVELTLLVGSYAIAGYLGPEGKVMDTAVRHWRRFLPAFFPLPHPSWRSIVWLRRNPWFETELLPDLRERVRAVL
jgi:uracil-DNA glycosylase